MFGSWIFRLWSELFTWKNYPVLQKGFVFEPINECSRFFLKRKAITSTYISNFGPVVTVHLIFVDREQSFPFCPISDNLKIAFPPVDLYLERTLSLATSNTFSTSQLLLRILLSLKAFCGKLKNFWEFWWKKGVTKFATTGKSHINLISSMTVRCIE